MKFDAQNLMQAVWHSIMEPSDAADRVIRFKAPREALWTGLALLTVLNVILLMLIQLVTPVPDELAANAIVISPIIFVAIIGVFLVLFSLMLYYVGRWLGGVGDFDATLSIVVWFQAISLVLEVVQFVLMLVSPAIASLFGMLSLGALIWVFMNFINILHGYENLGKSILAVILSLLGTALIASVFLAALGVAPAGG